MKKAVIALLVIILAVVPLIVTAQPRYEAKFSFSVAVNGKPIKTDSEYIYVYNSDVLDVSLNVETNEDYYAGPLSTDIYYSDEFLKFNTFTWNTNGRFYSCCKSYSNYSLKDENVPYFKVDMIPTSTDCKSAPASLKESLLEVQLTAQGKRDDVAYVKLDESTVRKTENPFGSMYFACYTDNGNLNGNRYDYGNEIKMDLSQADVKIKITDAGDVNDDGRITSADSLRMVQHATGLVIISKEKSASADIDSNGKINSSDGLVAMQIATGIKTINDILNR